MLVVKKVEQGYKVKHLLTEYSDVTYNEYYNALELCRARCHKLLKYDDLKVIKIPFISMWLVW